MEVWSFLISLELPEGRVEMGNYSLPFKSKIGARVCVVAEQRHKNLHGIITHHVKYITHTGASIKMFFKELHFELDNGGTHL